MRTCACGGTARTTRAICLGREVRGPSDEEEARAHGALQMVREHIVLAPVDQALLDQLEACRAHEMKLLLRC